MEATLVLDARTHTATVRGHSAQLTPLEFRILELLARNTDRVVTYPEVFSQVWGSLREPTPAMLKTHIHHLRKKLKLSEELQSAPGIGYRLLSLRPVPPEPRPITPVLADRPAPDLCWVVLKTRPNHERQAAEAITAQGGVAYVPLFSASGGAEATPLFPGYIFARVDLADSDLLRVRSAAGVAYVLPRGGPPSRLTDELMEAIRRRASHSESGLHHGDRVRITRGPFRWLDAVFDRRANPAGRVRILLQFVQRTVPLEIDERDLRSSNGVAPLLAARPGARSILN